MLLGGRFDRIQGAGRELWEGVLVKGTAFIGPERWEISQGGCREGLFWGKGVASQARRLRSCLGVFKARRRQQKPQKALRLGGKDLSWRDWCGMAGLRRHEPEPLLKCQRAGAALRERLGPPFHCPEVPDARARRTLVQDQMSIHTRVKSLCIPSTFMYVHRYVFSTISIEFLL